MAARWHPGLLCFWRNFHLSGEALKNCLSCLSEFITIVAGIPYTAFTTSLWAPLLVTLFRALLNRSWWLLGMRPVKESIVLFCTWASICFDIVLFPFVLLIVNQFLWKPIFYFCSLTQLRFRYGAATSTQNSDAPNAVWVSGSLNLVLTCTNKQLS